MRLAVLGHTYVVGANRGKLHALQRRGHDVLLLSPDIWHEPDFGAHRFDPEKKLSYELFACPGNGRVRRFIYPHRLLRDTLRQQRPDVLLAETEPGGLAALQAAYLATTLGIPLAVFAWENLTISGRSRLACLPVYAAARRLLAGSHGAADTARKAGYRGPVTVIPQVGVDPAMIPPRKKTRRKTLHALFIGRLDRKKGADLLLDALAHPNCRNWRATIVGDGDERQMLTTQAEALGLGKRVIFTGATPHDNVPRLFADADALVSPSRSVPGWCEQFGHILTWAMAAGVPIAGSRCGAIPEVVGDAGLLFTQNDVSGLVSCLQQLSDAEVRNKLGEVGLRRAAERYTDEALAARLERALVMTLEHSDVDDG